MAETWTQYGVKWGDTGDIEPLDDRDMADEWVAMYPQWQPSIVGRQVTASDWLPVDQGGAS